MLQVQRVLLEQMVLLVYHGLQAYQVQTVPQVLQQQPLVLQELLELQVNQVQMVLQVQTVTLVLQV